MPWTVSVHVRIHEDFPSVGYSDIFFAGRLSSLFQNFLGEILPPENKEIGHRVVYADNFSLIIACWEQEFVQHVRWVGENGVP